MLKKNKKSEIVKRPSWDSYFLKIAMLVGERATCHRHFVGAILVKNKQILTTGYNGSPSGLRDCFELGCLRDKRNIPSGTRHEICRAIHAEQNAVIQAALHGVSTEDSIMYCTHTPCVLCAKILVNAKIKRYVTYENYADKTFLEIFKKSGIEFVKIPKPKVNINTKG